MGKILFNARKFDKFGRITIPKTLRKLLSLKEEDLIGVFVDTATQQVVLEKLEVEEK